MMPDLVGFSTCVWNGHISLEIACQLKELQPGIVFGVPHVPDQPEAFYAPTRRSISLHNGGERTFLKLFEAWLRMLALSGVSMVSLN
jgi:hypothetical protein